MWTWSTPTTLWRVRGNSTIALPTVVLSLSHPSLTKNSFSQTQTMLSLPIFPNNKIGWEARMQWRQTSRTRCPRCPPESHSPLSQQLISTQPKACLADLPSQVLWPLRLITPDLSEVFLANKPSPCELMSLPNSTMDLPSDSDTPNQIRYRQHSNYTW